MTKVLVGLEQAVLFSPPEYAGQVEIQSGAPALRHWAPRVCDGLEISLLIGPSHDAIIEGRRTTTPGNITFIQLPGTVWSAEQVYGAFLSIELKPDLFASLRENWPTSPTLPGPSQIVVPELLQAFTAAHNAFRFHRDAMTTTEALVELLRQVLATITGIEPGTPTCDDVSRARDALHDGSNRSLTIDELATEAGLTPFEFVRAFQHSLRHRPDRPIADRSKSLARASCCVAAIRSMTWRQGSASPRRLH